MALSWSCFAFRVSVQHQRSFSMQFQRANARCHGKGGVFAPLGQSDFIYDTFDAAIDEHEHPERELQNGIAPRAQHWLRANDRGQRSKVADAASNSSAQQHYRRAFSTGDPFLDAAMVPPEGESGVDSSGNRAEAEADMRSFSRGVDRGRKLDKGVAPTSRAAHTHRFRFRHAHQPSCGDCHATNVRGRRGFGATQQTRDHAQQPARRHQHYRPNDPSVSQTQGCQLSRWEAFVARKGSIRFADIPWPSCTEICMTHTHRRAQYHAKRRDTYALKYKALRVAQRRWHPDKFMQKFGKRLDQRERARIIAKCSDVTAHLNTMQEALFKFK